MGRCRPVREQREARMEHAVANSASVWGGDGTLSTPQTGMGIGTDQDDCPTPGLWGPRAEALAEALERELPPPLWARVVELVAAVEDHAIDATRAERDAHKARVLAYFPGITPAWHAVSAYLETLAR